MFHPRALESRFWAPHQEIAGPKVQCLMGWFLMGSAGVYVERQHQPIREHAEFVKSTLMLESRSFSGSPMRSVRAYGRANDLNDSYVLVWRRVTVVGDIVRNDECEDSTKSQACEVILNLTEAMPAVLRKVDQVKTTFWPASRNDTPTSLLRPFSDG